MSADYVIWVNVERTVMVRRWDEGQMEVAVRDSASHVWGPPILVEPEDVLAGPGEKR